MNFSKVRSYLFLLMVLLSFGAKTQAGTFEFASNSVLAQGHWVKISVTESGICRLTYTQITNMGFNNPSEIRVFGYGGAALSEHFSNTHVDDLQEVPLYAGDGYFLFYAQGPFKWYDNHIGSSLPYDFTTNIYSNYGYYFVTDGAGVKKRISERTETAVDGLSTTDIRKYIDLYKYKKDELNYIASGKAWFGDKITKGVTSSYAFNFNDVDTTENATIFVRLAGYSTNSSSSTVTLTNGDSVFQKTISYALCNTYVRARVGTARFTFKPIDTYFSLKAKFNGNYSTDAASTERVIACVYRPLRMDGGTTFFRNYNACGTDFNARFVMKNCNANVQIWDLSDYNNPQRVKTTFSGDSIVFTDHKEKVSREFVAVNVQNPDFINATVVGNVSNQNLHGEQPVDLVIVTHPDFIDGAKTIASLHENYDEMTTLIVTPDQIYNEFSSGTPDATAFRWFFKKMYEDNDQKSFFVLLLGDGCYDNRGIQNTSSTKVNNYIITYQGGSETDETASYVTDDYFGFLDDDALVKGNANATQRISIGRIPCSSESELDGYINKMKTHLENKNYGKWKNKVILLADDNESSTSYHRFEQYSDNLAEKVKKYNNAMDVKKVYLDAYTRTSGSNGNRYYEVEDLLDEEIGNGVMIFNYVGHSSKIGFTAEHVFTQAKAKSIYNTNCGFWFTASCNFAQFDDLDISGGEDLILNPNGGAIGLVSAARTVFDNRNDNLDQSFFTHLFEREEGTGMPPRIGDVTRLAKQTLKNDSNKLSFTMLGDPALRLHYPNDTVWTDSLVEIGSEKTDSVKALSEIQVFGHIAQADSTLLDNFNGILYITLYDKEMTLYTKANIYSSEEDIIKYRREYKDRPNVLFSGQTEVVDGQFSFCFKVPKDINYNYGTGRLAYYAYDEENAYEAQGAYEKFIVGGTSDNDSYEEDGPEVTLYLNSTNFESGDKVNTSPVFYAVVSDENGINTSGAGIGHDITLTLNNSKTPITLNNYFTYSKNSYKSGIVQYQLSDLEEGTYTLTFKVWDLLNNSTTKSITFKVDKDAEIEIEDYIIYPNPAKESITMQVIHDRPQTLQSFRFLLYDLAGSLLYKSDDITSKVDGTLTLTWDLTMSNGRRINPGCYVGRIEVKGEEGDFIGKSKKIIVLPQ